METQMEISKRLKYIDDLNAFAEVFLHVKRKLLKLIEH